ncbi:MAG TPA: FecR domain-containing protein [Bryobacteraceae bacterium]|jgi:hypothetical protein|nr:FecR domain-containing protein [Bryobacteraceae bacterium]
MISIRFPIFLGILATAAWGANPAVPGTVNYVEGQAAINGESIDARSIGNAVVYPNQLLQTQHGRVEMLLTPGVFLRLGGNSSLRMISPGLIDTQVELTHGKALLEATDLKKENHIRVSVAGTVTTIEKAGLYEFDAANPRVSVYDGKASVTDADSHVSLGKGRETALNGRLQSQKFDRGRHDDLFAWSDVRSEYLAEASAASASVYVAQPYGWFGAGWYWNPFWSMYSFIPGNGIFYSPFGWGFYAPAYVRLAPYRWRGHGPWVARRGAPPRSQAIARPSRGASLPAFRGVPSRSIGLRGGRR